MFGRGKKEKKAKTPKPKKEKKAKAKAKTKKAKPAKTKKPKGPVKKRPTDIYAVMLMLSTAFVGIAVIFLAMSLSEYGFPSNPTPWK